MTMARYRGTQKIMASAAILDFNFFLIFEHTALLGVRIGLCMPNFVMIGLTVRKLLPFLFSIGNALKVPKNWCFFAILGVKTYISLSRPQKAPCAKTLVLTYHSPKSAHGFDQGVIPRDTKNNGFGGHLGFSIFFNL